MRRIKTFFVMLLSVLFATSAAFAQTAVVPSVESVSNKVQSYMASANITLATTPTDIMLLRGSATKTVYVKKVDVSCVKTSGGYGNAVLVKRSTATTGGTSATVTPTASDSSNSTATASVTSFTANPTGGTGVSMTQQYLAFPAPATLVESRPVSFTWGDQIDQYVVLRGVAQELGVYFGGQTLTGGVCSIVFHWLEK